MKRKLNEIEKELTKRGIERRKDQIRLAKEGLEINQLSKKHILRTREYEDRVLPYNRKVEDKNMQTRIEKFESDIEIASKDLENLKDQLKNGIEVKKPTVPTGVS